MTREQAEKMVDDFQQAVIDHEHESVARKYTREEVIIQYALLIEALMAAPPL